MAHWVPEFYILMPWNLGANISRLPKVLSLHRDIVMYILAYLATVPYFTFSFLSFPPTVYGPGLGSITEIYWLVLCLNDIDNTMFDFTEQNNNFIVGHHELLK